MATAEEQLEAAVGELPKAFGPDRPSSVGGRAHCYTSDELAILAGPRNEIPVDLISQVAREVPDHWDDFAGLYRRLTPRILPPLVTGDLPVDEALVGERLHEAVLAQWPAAERAAVDRNCQAWWRATLEQHPRQPTAMQALEFLVAYSGDVQPWLDGWTAAARPAASKHLADLCDHAVNYIDGNNRICLGFNQLRDVTAPGASDTLELLVGTLTDGNSTTKGRQAPGLRLRPDR
ncbi:MAG: hypothetical protein GEV07_18760 [Streptosporangiales bacterium]|nr:hypothetical protein [Streptosporangiales bacterium]